MYLIIEIVKGLICKRGLDRIRTDVDGFADHCLATRPRDLNSKKEQNYNFRLNKQFILLRSQKHNSHPRQ